MYICKVIIEIVLNVNFVFIWLEVYKGLKVFKDFLKERYKL